MKRFKISTKKESLKLITNYLIDSKLDFEFKSAIVGISSIIVYSKGTKEEITNAIKELITNNFTIEELGTI